MNVKVICSSCSKEFSCGDGQEMAKAKQRKIKHCKTGKELVVTYFYCPHCEHEHIVQLDDDNTTELFKQILSQMRTKVILSRQGKNVSRKDSKKFKRDRNLLSLYRVELMREFDGQLFTEESGVEFELKCTMGYTN